MTSDFGVPATLLIAAVVVPVYEEIQFRAIILGVCTRYVSFHWDNLVQALLFSLNHGSLSLAPFYLIFGLAAGAQSGEVAGS